MKKNFKLIIMGVAVLSVLYITACARKDKAKENAQADKDIVVKSFADDKKNTELDGKIDGDVYTNSVFNIKFDAKAANMEMTSVAEINAMSISHNDYSLKMEAQSSDSGSRVDFTVTVLDDGTDVGAYIDEDSATIKEENKGLGDENVKVESSTINFLGEDVKSLHVELTSGSVTYYRTKVFLKSNNHVAVIEVNSQDAQSIDNCLSAFTKAE
jgi:hypothetical protein